MKVCYKFFCAKTRPQSCKAFTGLSNHAQMLGWGHLVLP